MTNTDHTLGIKMIDLADAALSAARTDAERGLVAHVVQTALAQGVEQIHLDFFATVAENWSKTTA